MAKFILLLLQLLFVQKSLSLYEDQVGKFDWIQRYVGPVQHVFFDQSSTPSSKIIVSTSQNVIAALSTKSGEIIWRHVLEKDESGNIEAMNMNGQIVSVVTGNFLRSWNVVTAALISEVVLDLPENWENSFSHFYGFGNNHEELFLATLSDKTTNITVFDAASGATISKSSILPSWMHKNTKCKMAAKSILVCLDVIGGEIHFLATANQDRFSSVPLLTLGIAEVLQQQSAADPLSWNLKKVDGSDEYLIAKVGTARKLIHVHSDGLHLVKTLTKSQVISISGDILLSTVQTHGKIIVEAEGLTKSVAMPELKTELILPLSAGAVEKIMVNLFPKTGVQIFVSCADHSIHFGVKTGLIWSREEALSNIVVVETVDLPAAGAAEIYQEQLAQNYGILYSFLYRIKTHVMQIVSLKDTFSRPTGKFSSTLERDRFNLHKLLLIATASGKIYALDNWSGKVIWSVYYPQLSTFKDSKLLLFTQRTSAHFPRTPQCTVMGKSTVSGFGLLIVFNPLTGEGIGENGGVTDLGYAVVQASLIQQADEDYIKPLLVISEDLKPHVFPSNGEIVVLQMKSSMYLHLTDLGSSTFSGYTMRDSKPGALQLTKVWNLSFAKGSGSIVGVYGKRSYERVHSPGRVLADRSVLYKYANPNLVVVATVAYDPINKNTLSVHLVDSITGNIIESVSHKRVSGPYHFVHSENWVIYSAFNEKYRRNEVTTLEMFEGWEQSNSTVFSSFSARPTPPVVERQSFIMPQAVQAASHTTTEKGITTKFILFALKSGNVLQLSKWFLDPRRPVSAVGPMDEMLTPYMPQVPLVSQEMINYNHSLPRVHAIYTAPAGLESTCIVLIYGLDLFYTRLFPSQMFDMLKDDFDYYLIVAVLGGLIIASVVTRRLAQNKALKLAWK